MLGVAGYRTQGPRLGCEAGCSVKWSGRLSKLTRGVLSDSVGRHRFAAPVARLIRSAVLPAAAR